MHRSGGTLVLVWFSVLSGALATQDVPPGPTAQDAPAADGHNFQGAVGAGSGLALPQLPHHAGGQTLPRPAMVLQPTDIQPRPMQSQLPPNPAACQAEAKRVPTGPLQVLRPALPVQTGTVFRPPRQNPFPGGERTYEQAMARRQQGLNDSSSSTTMWEPNEVADLVRSVRSLPEEQARAWATARLQS